MAIRLPQAQFSDAPQAKKRDVPIEAILQALGNNPYANAINQVTPMLSQALEKRKALQRAANQTSAIEKAVGAPEGSFDKNLGPDLALKAYEAKTGRLKEEKPGPTYVIPQFDANGGLVGTTPLLPGQKPGPAGRPQSTFGQERIGMQKERIKKDVLDRFNADPSVRKAQSSMEAARNVRDLIENGSPIAAAAIPTYMARASGEVGNLSEADKAPFGGSQAILARLEAALTQKATGRLTSENAQFLKGLSDTMESSANRNIDGLARLRSKQYSNASDIFNEADLYETLRPQMGASPLRAMPMPGGQNESPAQRKARLIQELSGAR